MAREFSIFCSSSSPSPSSSPDIECLSPTLVTPDHVERVRSMLYSSSRLELRSLRLSLQPPRSEMVSSHPIRSFLRNGDPRVTLWMVTLLDGTQSAIRTKESRLVVMVHRGWRVDSTCRSMQSREWKWRGIARRRGRRR